MIMKIAVILPVLWALGLLPDLLGKPERSLDNPERTSL